MVSVMKFLKEKIFVALMLFSFFGSSFEAPAQVFSQQNCMEILIAHSKSPTPFLQKEDLDCMARTCEEVPFFSSNAIALAKNLIISQAGFFVINILLFHQELFYGQVNLQTLFAVSSYEISKNLINYVITENGESPTTSILKALHLENFVKFDSIKRIIQLSTAMIAAAKMNQFRRTLHLPDQVRYSQDMMDYITGSAEILKNFINFQITENTFPPDWSKPPSF